MLRGSRTKQGRAGLVFFWVGRGTVGSKAFVTKKAPYHSLTLKFFFQSESAWSVPLKPAASLPNFGSSIILSDNSFGAKPGGFGETTETASASLETSNRISGLTKANFREGKFSGGFIETKWFLY